MYERVFYFCLQMSSYNKPYLNFTQQLQLLKSRGLEVTNDAAAMACLGRIGYYRLSAYWYSFRKTPLMPHQGAHKIVLPREDSFSTGSRRYETHYLMRTRGLSTRPCSISFCFSWHKS
jgi:hypothetical protein